MRGILGAGHFGRSLALSLAKNNIDTVVWHPHQARITELQKLSLPKKILFTADLEHAVKHSKWVAITLPTKVLSDYLQDTTFIKTLSCATGIINGSKGVCLKQQDTIWYSDIIINTFPNIPFAVLSGPTFAQELTEGKITAATCAGTNNDLVKTIQNDLSNDYFRIYPGTDYRGVEVAGALKNVLAIAYGIVDGNNMGANARAALITRGLAEMTRLGIKTGGKQETFLGLAGIGDLVLTATGDLSRNRNFGIDLSKGKSIQQAIQKLGTVEGYYTSRIIPTLEQRYQTALPIMRNVHDIIYNKLSTKDAITNLLNRPLSNSEM